jgi:hypothetical protein
LDAAIGLERGLLEFVYRVDTAFGVAGVELADHYCCHFGWNPLKRLGNV